MNNLGKIAELGQSVWLDYRLFDEAYDSIMDAIATPARATAVIVSVARS